MLFDEKLDHDDYKIIKRECEEKLKRLELALTEAKVQNSNQLSIDDMLLKAIEALSKLNELFLDGDILTKREVLGSIFREKLGVDGMAYRTGRISEPAKFIFQINKELRLKKTGKNTSHCIFPVKYRHWEINRTHLWLPDDCRADFDKI